MMEFLATAEPQLTRIITANAESNGHMIAINEAMGYTVFGRPITWSRLGVAAVPRLAGISRGRPTAPSSRRRR